MDSISAAIDFRKWSLEVSLCALLLWCPPPPYLSLCLYKFGMSSHVRLLLCLIKTPHCHTPSLLWWCVDLRSSVPFPVPHSLYNEMILPAIYHVIPHRQKAYARTYLGPRHTCETTNELPQLCRRGCVSSDEILVVISNTIINFTLWI